MGKSSVTLRTMLGGEASRSVGIRSLAMRSDPLSFSPCEPAAARCGIPTLFPLQKNSVPTTSAQVGKLAERSTQSPKGHCVTVAAYR